MVRKFSPPVESAGNRRLEAATVGVARSLAEKYRFAALLLAAPAAAISGRRMRAIRRACEAATAIDDELRGLMQDPMLKLSLGVRIAVTPALVLLMGAKPEMRESAAIAAAFVAVGLLGTRAPLPSRSANR